MAPEALARYWRYEKDRTVSGEIISPISYDEDETWHKLKAICDTIKAHGGTVSGSVGSHVHVGVPDFGHETKYYGNFLRTIKEHEDITYRLAQNPRARQHRGVRWCGANWRAREYQDVIGYRQRYMNHSNGINLAGATGEPSGHVEFRMWDGSLDPGVIQTQIKLSLALVDRTVRVESQGAASPLGSTSEARARRRREGTNITGRALMEEETKPFRTFLDQTMSRTSDKEQAAALFATTSWFSHRRSRMS